MRDLARVLQRLHAGGIRLPMLQSLPVAPAGPANPPLPRDELVSLLADVSLGAGAAGGAATAPPDIRHAIESIVANRGPLSLGQSDEDIINVVAMFFDIVLEDRNLPIEIQALVGRLQLPILRVALKDRSFFTDRKHPARQLINEIARTSVGWESSDRDEQDALFIRLTELVEQVLQGSAEHADVFEKCLNDLLGFISNQDSRAGKLERRTREQAAAQARSAQSREVGEDPAEPAPCGRRAGAGHRGLPGERLAAGAVPAPPQARRGQRRMARGRADPRRPDLERPSRTTMPRRRCACDRCCPACTRASPPRWSTRERTSVAAVKR